MSEEKKPKKQRKSTAAAPPTEHKPSWQEKYASPEEIEQMLSSRVLQRHNEAFTTTNDEMDLVAEYFRQPRGAEVGEFMRTAVAKQLVSSPGMNISTVALGRAFKQLGFRPATVGHSRGYYVVRITPEERKQRAVSMGYDAWKQQVSAASKDTDVTDVS